MVHVSNELGTALPGVPTRKGDLFLSDFAEGQIIRRNEYRTISD